MSSLPFDRFDLPHPSGDAVLKISIARPKGLAEGAKAPILFVTDADIAFEMAAEIARFRAIGGQLSPVVVVGIGYGAEFAEMGKLRTADLTPPLSEEGLKALGGATGFIGDKSGGADALVGFIVDVLKPEVLRRCPEADGERTILFGHSLGGLFSAYALLTRPDAFSVYLASSPSLWWDGFAVLRRLEGFADRVKALPAQPRVLVDVGALEEELPTEVPQGFNMTLEEVQAMVAQARMVVAAREFYDALLKQGLTEVEHVAFEGEDHMTVVPAALMRGLTFALKGWK